MLKTFRGIDVAPRLPEPAALLNWLKIAARFVLLAGLAFALSRVTTAGGLAPFAVALFAAGLAAGKSTGAMLVGCLLGAVHGSLETFSLSLPIGCAVALGGSIAWNAAGPGTGRLRAARRRAPEIQARSPNRRRRALKPPSVQAAALAGAGVLAPGLAFARGELWPSAQALCACLAAVAASPFLLSALSVRPGRAFLLPEERTGLFLLCGMLAAGFQAIWPPAAICLCTAGILVFCHAGAMLGAGLGAAMLLASGDVRAMAPLAVCGAAAQLCGELPRPVRVTVPVLAALAAGALAGTDLLRLAGICAAGPAAALLPENYRKRMTGWVRRPERGVSPDRLAMLVRGRPSERLRAMSAAFGTLAEGYLAPVSMPDEQALMAELRDRLCEGCPGYAGCWAGESNRAARLLCDLIAMAVTWSEQDADGALFEEGVPPDVSRRCRRSRVIPERLAGALESFARRRSGELKRGGENRLIAAQFLQAQRLLDGLAAEASAPVRLRGLQAQRAAGVLERAGFELSDAMMLAGRRPELMVTLRDARWTPALANAASSQLARAFGRVYEPAGAWGGTLRLVRRPRLQADFGAASIPREAGLPSGDSHLVKRLDDDRLLVLLCDGMGSGEAAARESAGAARLLGSLLAAGADWPLAVETANALLINASAEEMFSTADVLILDLSSGMAEMVKLAACPTLIARGGGVERVEGGHMPLGILDRLRPCASRVQLMPGDVILMASDGVLDAADGDALDALLIDAGARAAGAEESGMNALAEAVLAIAQGNGAGTPRDDMTAVCVRLETRA